MTTLSQLIDWVLKDAKKPLSAKEIWDLAVTRYYTGDVEFGGKTLCNAIEDTIYRDISDNKHSRYRYEGTSPLRYYLRPLEGTEETRVAPSEQPPQVQPQSERKDAGEGLSTLAAMGESVYDPRMIAVHYVMAELLRRKCMVAPAKGGTSITKLAGQRHNGRGFSVRVKSKLRSVLSSWLIGDVKPEEDMYFVLVEIPRQVAEPPRFYILTCGEAMKLRQQWIDEYGERKRRQGEPHAERPVTRYFPARISLRAIDNAKFAERWDKILS